MQILPISDLHFEFHDDGGAKFVESLPTDGVDVLVVAGDAGNFGYYEKGLRLLAEKFKAVIYVHGNHECYGSSIDRTRADIRRIVKELSNVHFLDNDVLELGGQRFVGTTMWFRPHPDVAIEQCEMHDFDDIENLIRRFPVENAKALSFLNAAMRKDDVVITHHAPAFPSIPGSFKSSPLSTLFYVCDQNELIHERQPALWIHGHIHNSWDYSLWGTRVVANPYGYHGDTVNENFDPRKRVQV